MRAIVYLALPLVLLNFFGGAAMAEDRLIRSPEIEITRIQPNGHIFVTMTNHWSLPIKVWDSWNSWGAMNWRVLILRNGRLQTYYRNPNQMFTRNFAAFKEIPSEGQLEYDLDLNGGDWCDGKHCSSDYEKEIGGKMISLEPNDMVFVIYDVHITREAGQFGVWYGTISTHQTYMGQ